MTVTTNSNYLNQNHWGIIFDYQAATVALSQFTVNLRWIILDVKLLFLLLCSRKIHVPSQSKTCYSPWNALQVIFVLFTVGTMISMMWFTIILKTSLESMRKRITSCKLAPLPCSLPVIIIFAINSELREFGIGSTINPLFEIFFIPVTFDDVLLV